MYKLLLVLCAALMTLLSGCATSGRSSKADIVVLPLGGEVKVTEGSIVYALPLTVIEFDVILEKTTEIPGPYADFAYELLGLENVIRAENEKWSLRGIRLNTLEELDPEQFYIIQGTTIMESNVLALKKNGLVLDITPDIYTTRSFSAAQGRGNVAGPLFPDMGADEYVSFKTDTAFRVIKADTAFIRVPYLLEKKKKPSLAEAASSAAKKLLELREGKHMLLTGETNVFPQGDAAINEINRLDREYTALFAGKYWTEERRYRFWFTPDPSSVTTKTILFKFSSSDGIRPAGAENGVPVTLELVPSGKTRDLTLVVRPVTSEREITANDRLYYRVPDIVDIRVNAGGETLCTARKLIYQYGNTVTLPANFIIGK